MDWHFFETIDKTLFLYIGIFIYYILSILIFFNICKNKTNSLIYHLFYIGLTPFSLIFLLIIQRKFKNIYTFIGQHLFIFQIVFYILFILQILYLTSNLWKWYITFGF